MDFSILARNWLALHGDFKTFDYSIFTNSGIAKDMYENFCYYAAGFSKDGVLPEQVFKNGCDLLSSKDSTVGKNGTVVPVNYKGMLECFTYKFQQQTMQKAFEVLKSYVFNPDSKLLTVSFASGETMNQTLFQYVLMQYCNKSMVTVDDLMQLNLITNTYEKKTTQVYIIGSVVISPLSNDRFTKVLQKVYECVLSICQTWFLGSIGDLTVLSMNEGTDSAKKSTIKHYITYLCVANVIGITLNDLFHLFGYNIPDAMHSIDMLGTITFINDQQKFSVLTKSKTIETCAVGELPQHTDSISLLINADSFNAQYPSNVRRIEF